MAKFRMRICPTPRASYNTIYDIYIVVVVVLLLLLLLLLIAGPRRICDIYDFFAPHINVLTYLLTYLLVLPLKLQISAAADEPARQHRAVDDQCDKLAVDPL